MRRTGCSIAKNSIEVWVFLDTLKATQTKGPLIHTRNKLLPTRNDQLHNWICLWCAGQ